MRLSSPLIALLVAVAAWGCASPAPDREPAARTTASTDPPDALADLNASFRASYASARARALAAEGPVVLVMGDDLVLVHGAARERRRAIPPAYHDLKSVAHVPLAVYVTLADTDGAPAPEVVEQLEALADQVTRVRASRLEARFPAAELPRQHTILRACASFVAAVLRERDVSRERIQDFARGMAPLVLGNAASAARLQIEGYDRVVEAWRATIPPEEWARATAVISGSQLPRAGALPVQYFARLLGRPGEPAEGRRVIYAESIWDPDKSLRLLGTHVLDRRIATAFFGDEDRMHRDLLSDAASAILAERGPGER